MHFGLSTALEQRVTIEFCEGLSLKKIVDEIAHLSDPQVIMWYIGSYGAREAGIRFYRDFLIHPILKNNTHATFWLVDLTAWGAFKSPLCTIQKSSKCADTIEELSGSRLRCIKASSIFKKMQEITDEEVIEYFQRALHREFIQKTSATFPDANILVSEIFPKDCPMLRDWYHYDTGKAYSIFQYLEGCLLIDEVFTELVRNRSTPHIEIVFALPNDEIKYYKDDLDSFHEDVEFLIAKRCEALRIEDVKLHIKFLAFPYGTRQQDRPYNAPGKVLKKNALTYEDMVGRLDEMDIMVHGVKYATRR